MCYTWTLGTALAFLLLAAGALVGQEGQKAGKKSEEPWVHSKPEEGMVLSALIASETMAGAPIPLKIKLTNKGTDLGVLAINRWTELQSKLTVVDSDRKGVPLTRYGVKRLAPTEIEDILWNARASYQLAKIMPSKSIDLGIDNLGLFFDLTIPGDYSVTVTQGVRVDSKGGAKNVELKTPTLRFTIERP